MLISTDRKSEPVDSIVHTMVFIERRCFEPENTMAFKDSLMTVVQVLTPVSFLIKETPGPQMSPSGRAYLSLECRMRELAKKGAVEPVSLLPPPLGSVALVMKPGGGQYHRARVTRLFERDHVQYHHVQVSLVDFGEKMVVPCDTLCKMPSKEFLDVPFQCVRFSLYGLKPVHATDGKKTATSGCEPGSLWDVAAEEFVEAALDGCCSMVQIQVVGKADSGELCGKAYINCDGGLLPLDEELVKHGYASWDLGILGALHVSGSGDDGQRSEEGALVESSALGRVASLCDAGPLTSVDSTPGHLSSDDMQQSAPPCGHLQSGKELESASTPPVDTDDSQVLEVVSKARKLRELVGKKQCSPRESEDPPMSLNALSGLGGSAVERIMHVLEPENKETSGLKPASEPVDYGDFMVLHQLGEEEADSDAEETEGKPLVGSGAGDEDLADDIRDFQEDRSNNCTSFSEIPPDFEKPYPQFQEAVSFSTDYRPAQQGWFRMGFLCHGQIPPMPAASLDEMSFDGFLKEQLCSLGFRRPSRTQSVLWPVVMNNRNVLAVAPPRSGRTLAYLVPLVSRLLTEKEYWIMSNSGGGPLVLVLTSSWEGAQRIHDQVKALQQSRMVQQWDSTAVVEYRDPTCCILYGGGGEDGKEQELTNGVDIVVATPFSLWRLMDKHNKFIINLERCCHLVLDDADKLLGTNETGRLLVEKTLSEYWQCFEKRQADCGLTQVVVCADRWTPALQEFHRKANLGPSPLVVMGSFLEASAYTGVPTVAHYVREPDARGSALLGVLHGNLGCKVVVCIEEKERAVAVHQLIQLSGVRSLVLHEGLSRRDMSELVAKWAAQKTSSVLVVQDSVLPMSGVRDAAVLIQYNVPRTSEPIFGFRYSCIAEHMPMFRTEEATDTPAVKPVVHLLLSKDNSPSSPEMVELLERFASPIPDGLKQLAEEEEQRRQVSSELALCPRLKAFGRCGRRQCSFRHQIVPEVDHPPCWSHLPSGGEVRILVTRVIDASHFYAWILQERPLAKNGSAGYEDKPAVRKNQELQEAMTLLNEYFGEKGNYRMLNPEETRPEVGQVYGLEVSTGRFQRVLVSSVEGTGDPKVTVTHMDYGGQSCVPASRLLYLPELLTRLGPFAVEVYCCRLQPWDGDLEWPLQASTAAHRLFVRKELVGKVVLRLGKVLWLDPLMIPQRMAQLGMQMSAEHVRSALLDCGLAQANADHVESVRRIAKEAGLPVPQLLTESASEGAHDGTTGVAQPSSAFLETTGYRHVFLCCVESPSCFYVRQVQFSSCLETLEDDIEQAVQEGRAKPLRSVREGQACLARFETTDRWYRAQVREVLNEGQEAEVFFPDYGDTDRFSTDQLRTVLPWMMTLPYQAVRCSLAGVRPETEDGWGPTAWSTLEDFGYDEANNNRPLCLRVARQTRDGQCGGSSYEVFLFDTCKPGRVSAADWLIQRGLAVARELPALDFDWTVPHTPLLEGEASGETESEDEITATELECQQQMEEQMSRIFGVYNRFVLGRVLGLPIEASGTERAAKSSHSAEVYPEKCQHPTSEGSSEVERTAQDKQETTPREEVPTLSTWWFDPGDSPRAPVSWWQDEKFVHVTVRIPDGASFEMEINASVISLRAWVGEEESVLCEWLFAPVNPEKTKLVRRPEGVKVTLEKACTSLTWDFLTLQHKKLPYIRYDLDHITVSDDEDDITSSFAIKKDTSDEDLPAFAEGTRTLPYDPVAHEERLVDEDTGLDEDVPHILDPNDIFEAI